MLDLFSDQPIFIGFKLDTNLKRQLEAVEGPERKYVSEDDSTFLRVCRIGDDRYVGKVVHEPLTVDRIEDIRRNILSIMQRLCPETRLPSTMKILAAGQAVQAVSDVGDGEPGRPSRSE